ncbi:prepilin peptidase [Mixta theicola]|uniref:Prepilin leader peptidase/N-methyltransferase n=1 Tax=Mixta theicola TaxID=1458355 RepID=A0A2K1QBA5_9GAMM|nr:A24 family peptidase [Mixta theicola]PNS12310.1 prepilin peptidase [Mixta theicola]GLR08067.1 type 4 prepilin-like proteins leader peptide-processing enzyme [Mixta theicola]
MVLDDIFLVSTASLPPWLGWSSLTIIGLCVGSFLNVIIYRVPLMIAAADRLSSTETGGPQDIHRFNLWLPASHCPRCQQTVAWHDNIPLISWLLLQAKCRHCRQAISGRYPTVEAASLVLTLVAGYYFPPGVTLCGVLLFGWLLLALTVIDLDCGLLPDWLTYSLLWSGLLFNLHDRFVPLSSAVIGAVAGYTVLWLIVMSANHVTGKQCMGYGDLKLTAALGAWLGWQALPLLLLLASSLGVLMIVLLNLLAKKSLNTALPFGPALAFSASVLMVMNQLDNLSGW